MDGHVEIGDQTLRAIAAVFAFHAFYLAWSHDLGFIEGIRESHGLDARPTRKELLERGEAW